MSALIGNQASVTLDTDSDVHIVSAYNRKVKMPLRTASTDTLQAVAAWLDEGGFDPDAFDNPWHRLRRYELEEK